MKITIDAAPLLLRSAGVKAYLYHWIRALRRAGSGHRFSLFPLVNQFEDLDHETSMAGPIRTPLALLFLHVSRWLPVLDALRTDVFHATILTRIPPRRALLTATVHDMTCWRLPEVHTAVNIKADRHFADAVLKKAHGLITVSECTRRDLIELLGVAPEKVVTIHSGVAPEYFTAQDTSAAKTHYGLTKPYVLHVGTIEPRKNLDRLMDAWQSLPAEYRDAFDLVFVGPRGWAAENTAARISAQARWLGYVRESDLPALTQGAELLAYPSLYEGFGFPVAQAMAGGVAVLTSNGSSLPEVAGEGAVYVDPMSPSSIGSSLRELLDSPDQRRRLGQAGRERAQRFTWERCAAESLRFFERLPLG